VDLLVASDAEEILGIGDWGANGMDIERPASEPWHGVHQRRTSLARPGGASAGYVETATGWFPNALLHFEDFGPSDARPAEMVGNPRRDLELSRRMP
jgi:malate dehydrogenase (oxaloacetate-decarboxylating)